jgi:hypothetical protein
MDIKRKEQSKGRFIQPFAETTLQRKRNKK